MKAGFLIVSLATLFALLPLGAQESSSGEPQDPNASEFYYFSVPIEKIYPYRKGYVVTYRKGRSMTHAYIPQEWFFGAAAKGDMIPISSGTRWPSMTVFYKNGEFDHVRLYVRKERAHQTWGDISQGVNIDDRFEGVEGLAIEF